MGSDDLLLGDLAVLLGDPLLDHLAVDGLLDVAVLHWNLLALLLGSVHANLQNLGVFFHHQRVKWVV